MVVFIGMGVSVVGVVVVVIVISVVVVVVIRSRVGGRCSQETLAVATRTSLPITGVVSFTFTD